MPLQLPVVPLIVYTVVEAGFSVWLAPLRLPGFHVYEVAPVAVSTVEPPLQISADGALMVTDEFTVTVVVIDELHPPLVPVIV